MLTFAADFAAFPVDSPRYPSVSQPLIDHITLFMDRNSIIGIGLIFALFVVWTYTSAPSEEQLAAQQATADSLALVEQQAVEVLDPNSGTNEAAAEETTLVGLTDSARIAQLGGTLGPFAAAGAGTAEVITLENDLMTVEVNTKGGAIKKVTLKKYTKVVEDAEGNEYPLPLELLEDRKNRFEYILPVAGIPSGGVRTSDLYFSPTLSGQTLTMRAPATNGGYFEQSYSIKDGTYLIDYDLKLENLGQVLTAGEDKIQLHWENYLDKIEKNARYEANYSTVYFKAVDDGSDHCSCTGDDVEELEGQAIKWVSHAQQFFNTSLIAGESFGAARFETIATGDNSTTRTAVDPDDPETFEKVGDLKKIQTDLAIPIGRSSTEVVDMALYVGPNEFERLQAIGYDLSDIIPFGRSIFGAINRWVIRPIFTFLDGFIGNKGIAILILTLFVKILVFPLTYKMLVSQSKMQVLKPQIEKLKKKHDGDKQAI
ncbi:MAG: membrane protein insertase YidC, partial [Saprospiraceae bacterium]